MMVFVILMWKYLLVLSFILAVGFGEDGYTTDTISVMPDGKRVVGSSVTLSATYYCPKMFGQLYWRLGGTSGKLMASLEASTNCAKLENITMEQCAANDCSIVSRCHLTWLKGMEDGENVVSMVLEFIELMVKDSQYVYLSDTSVAVNTIKSKLLVVEYCPDLRTNQSEIITIRNGKNGTLGAKANYTCNVTDAHQIVVNGEYFGGNYVRSCQANATWDGENQVECYYAPKNVNVYQGSEYAKHPANFSCNFTHGFPEDATVKYYIEDKEKVRDYQLSSGDNLKSFSCHVSNNYTDRNSKAVESTVERLTVYFSPEDPRIATKNEYSEKNSTEELKFSFKANPKNGDIVVNVTLPNGTVKNVTSQLQPETKTTFRCRITVTLNNEDDYGEYTFTAYTTMPKGQNSSSVIIEESPGETTAADTTTGSIAATTAITTVTTNETEVSGPSIALIAGICGGLAFLVFVLLIVYFVIRRNRQKQPEESVREERMNEIYGSTPRHTVDDESSRTREEKANVLYISSGEAGGIEEAYAAIDKKGKKKSNDNSAYSPEVAYAAVNKPKKNKKPEEPQEAVYSAVNKKKKEKDVDKEPGLHGSPTAGEA